MNDAIVSILLLAGSFFAAIAGIGLLRFRDVLLRMHASTKAGTLGVGLIVLAIAIHLGFGYDTTRAVLIIGFLLLTAPVGAHLIGRAAYRTGTPLWADTKIETDKQWRCEPSTSLREEAVRLADGGKSLRRSSEGVET